LAGRETEEVGSCRNTPALLTRQSTFCPASLLNNDDRTGDDAIYQIAERQARGDAVAQTVAGHSVSKRIMNQSRCGPSWQAKTLHGKGYILQCRPWITDSQSGGIDASALAARDGLLSSHLAPL